MSAVMPYPEISPTYQAELLAKYPQLAAVNYNALSGLVQFPLDNTTFINSIFTAETESFPLVTGFPDNPQTTHKNNWFGKPVRNGKLPACIKDTNNNFIDINMFMPAEDGTPSRKDKYFAGCYIVPADDIGTKVPLGSLKLQPSYIIETSPGNFQYGYILSSPLRDPVLAKQITKALVDGKLTDPGMNTLGRYVRLPAGVNSKKEHVDKLGAPFSQKVHAWNPERRFTIEEIIEGLGLNLTPPPAQAMRLALPVNGSADDFNSILEALQNQGLYKSPDSKPGSHEITCPWVHEHTDEIDAGTSYIEPCPEFPKGGFHCFHGHCQGRTLKDLKKALGVEDHDQIIATDFHKLHLTDTGFAELCSDYLEGTALYWREPGKWLIWDGKRWVTDMPGELFPYIKNIIKNLMREALDIDTPEKKDRVFKALLQLESHTRQETLIRALSVVPRMIVEHSQLDSDPMLLTCINGTLDLRSGTLLPHTPQHLITRLVNIDYDTNATCPVFEKFMIRIFNDDKELIGYMQRLFGYCLTGRTDEQIMVFFYGLGGNGKTTLLNILLKLLADFACSAQADLLMIKDRQGANNELARLRGAGVVAVNEVEEGAKLAEANLKTLTGGDTVIARFLFKEHFEFKPQFKMILVGNHKPVIRGRDLGIWRRIHLVPFTVTIPENERDLRHDEILMHDLPGILRWAVEGCLWWQRTKLNSPETIKVAIEQYRRSEDVFDSWLQECCETGSDFSEKGSNLHESFMKFASWRALSAKRFSNIMEEAGFTKRKSLGVILWEGLKLSFREVREDQRQKP